MMFDLGLQWLDHNGQPTSDRRLGAPCIEVSVGPVNQELKLAGFVKTFALIDTGANLPLVEAPLVSRFSTGPIRESVFTGNWGSQKAEIHQVAIYLGGADTVMDCDVGSMPAPTIPLPFRVVLGLDLLQRCRLVIDGTTGESSLHFRYP